MKKLVVAALSMALAVQAIADHLPAKLLARGKPENTLAGMNLQTTSLEEVLRKYGPPTKKITLPNKSPMDRLSVANGGQPA